MHLNGLRILNTRPVDQGQSLMKAIQQQGGITIDLPTLAIESTSINWKQQLPSLQAVNQAIFISHQAVRYFFKMVPAPLVHSIRVSAIGPNTAHTLAAYGTHSVQIPSIADSEHLLALDSFQEIKNQTILLIKGEGGRSLIEQTLNQRQAHVIPLSVYRRIIPPIPEARTQALWQEDAIDVILFTSQTAMAHLFQLFNPQAHSWIRHKPCIVISSRLAEEARKLGMRTIFTSPYDALLETLKGLLHDG